MNAFTWVTQLIYLGSATCFVLGLHLMNTPATARCNSRRVRPTPSAYTLSIRSA